MLCPIEKWTCYDGNFNHKAFVNSIVKLFKSRPTHPWVVKMLAWWDKYVPISSDTISDFCREIPGLQHCLKKWKRPIIGEKT
jgi:hypothetical protein